MQPGEKSEERNLVDVSQYKDYKELPLVSTGCDSYASWDPRFKHLSPMLEISAIIERFKELLPGSTFGPNKHLIITGGEPLLGWQKAYPELLEECIKMGLTHLTFETNGTQKLSPELTAYLEGISERVEITFSISAKLPCSGESWESAIKPLVVAEYIKIPHSNNYFKFVVASKQDVIDTHKAIAEYASMGVDITVYLMPIGGVNEVYELNERQVADYCRDNGLRFSPRIQVPLYKNAWGT